MSKRKKDYKDGIITVTIPYVKKRDIEDGKLTIQGNRTYRVPVNVFADEIYKVLAKYPYADTVTSKKIETTTKNEMPTYFGDIMDYIYHLI